MDRAEARRFHRILLSWNSGPVAEISNAHIAPKLSKECVQFIERLIRSAVPPEEIITEHRKRISGVVRSKGSREELEWSRDMQLSTVNIRNIQNRLHRECYMYHNDDAQAVRQWTERFPDYVLHYQEQSREVDTRFTLVVSSPWMMKILAVYGHEKAICLDATHGTNKYGFQLFTWMIYDTHQNGIPVVWALLERHQTENLQLVQEKIKLKVESTHADVIGGTFRPSCLLTDDSAEEKASIRAVYLDCHVDLCIWHMRCAFNKNLTNKLSSDEQRPGFSDVHPRRRSD